METTKQSVFFHKRPITDIRFHPDGDLLFASSKDSTASMMNLDGKLLGSFHEHHGSITTLSPSEFKLATGCTDMTLILWDILTGSIISSSNVDSVIRGCDFSDNLYFCTDKSMNKESFLGRYDIRTNKPERIHLVDSSPTSLFKSTNYLIFSNDSGEISKFDLRSNKIIGKRKVHKDKITALKPSACRSFFVSASKDSYSKIIDCETFEEKKVFGCDEPVNSAAIFPTNDKLVVVGGIDARDVTTTRGKGSFDALFFDVVTQQRVGHFTMHFGTINTVDVHPSGTHFATGSEDGSFCLVKLGLDFNNAPFTSFA